MTEIRCAPSHQFEASASLTGAQKGERMPYDKAKIDEAVLAVLYLTAWEEHGA
jgi:hypothetical protein